MFEIINQHEFYEIRSVKFDDNQSFPYVTRYDVEKDMYYTLTTSNLCGRRSDEFYQVPISKEIIYIQKRKKTLNTIFDTEHRIKLSFEEFEQLGGTSYEPVGLTMYIDYKGIQRYYSKESVA